MLKLIKFLRPFARYLLIAWILTIITLSSLPNIPTLKIHTAHSEIRLDYLIHFCEYGVLAFMAFLTFTGDSFRINFRKYVVITLCLIALAFLDELHQKFVPGRAYNIKDALSNTLGILGALGFCVVVFRKIAGNRAKYDKN